MKKVVKLLVSGLEDTLEDVLEEALKEAWKKLWEDVGEPVKPKRKRAKATEPQEPAQDEPDSDKPNPQAEAKAPRHKGPKVEGKEVGRLIRALADLGPHLGKSPKGTPMEEILERRAQTLVRYALPGRATQVLEGVLGYLRSLTLEDARREALRGFRDLAHAAGVGALLKPEE